MRLLHVIPLLVLASLPARTAAAQHTDAAGATALFQEGRDAAKRGDYATACVKMAESQRLDPATGTLLNLADCQEHLGHLATAWELFEQAADKLAPDDKRLAAVKARVAALEARLPRLAVSLAPGTPPGAQVTRDGIALGAGSFGTALPVDPGPHLIVASAPGRAERRYPVQVAEGHTERVVIELDVAATPPPGGADGPAPSTGLGPIRIAGIAIGGAGVVLIGAAIGTGVALPSKQSTIDQNCGAAVHLPVNHCNPAGFDAAQSGKTLATANTATWIAGGIAAAAGVALVVVGSVGQKRGGDVRVGVGPGFVSLEGTFE